LNRNLNTKPPMPKQYRLLRDLPNCGKRRMVEYDEENMEYFVRTNGGSKIYFQPLTVENNSDWFEIVEKEPFMWDDKLVEELVWENFGAADTRYRIEQFKKEKQSQSIKAGSGTANDVQNEKKKSPYKDINGNEIFEGDMVKGIGKHKGQSEVFFEYDKWQPFDYLNDYDGNNYEIVKPTANDVLNSEEKEYNKSVSEFIEKHHGDMDKMFPPSKPLNSEWEIVSVENNIHGVWVFDASPFDNQIKNNISSGKKMNCNIHSVKRLSDGEVWKFLFNVVNRFIYS